METDDEALEAPLDIRQLQRGSLLRIREDIMVHLGDVIVDKGGEYFMMEDSEEYPLPPGTLVVFLGVSRGNDDAFIVLADGSVGWVFRDEVEAP